MPKVSIIMPIYNKMNYLKEIFSCLQKQQLDDFECIMIDDGSTDKSGFICDQLSSLDNRFITIHIPNGGVSHARNIGLKIAKGEYITFIDADDQVPENYLSCMYGNIIDTNSDMVICSVVKVWNSDRKIKIQLPQQGLHSMKSLLDDFAEQQKKTGIYGYCCGKFFSKALIESIFFDESISLAEDFDFFLRVYPKCNSIFFTEETAYNYIQNTDNSSAVIDDYNINYRKQLDINLNYKTFLNEMGAYSDFNKKIVSELLSNYVFFTLFYCSISEFYSCFYELKRICDKQNITLNGQNILQKWFFLLLLKEKSKLAKLTLYIYRYLRNFKMKIHN